MTLPEVRTNEFNCCANIRMLHPIQNKPCFDNISNTFLLVVQN